MFKIHMICSKGPLSSDFESSCEVLVTAKGFLEGEKTCSSNGMLELVEMIS